MAMTNEMIILTESVKLMEEGILKGSGNFVEVEINGEVRKIEMPETIHTYKKWGELGYQVQRGEKSKVKFMTWYYDGRNSSGEDEENSRRRGKCYMRMTSFFTMDQVKAKETA